MDYKKAYEAALERARQGLPINEVFPELKESEDERIRKNCIHFLELQKIHHADTSEIDDCIAYLEKQKEQKPAEWSEKEKGILLECISALQNSGHWLLADKLSSLRPQPHWKPSEEQMKVLNEVVGDYRAEDTASCEKTANILESLYNDLESL